MTDYDIRAAVRAVMDETDLTAPEEVAAKVAGDVPAKSLRPVLAFVLRDYVRIQFGVERMSNHLHPLPTRSAKVEAYREYAARWLRERVHVGNSEYKLLGDCTLDNVRYLEAERRENAARSLAVAERFAQLAEVMARHKARRVADLSPQVLSAFNDVEAAA
ncbi:MAG TPA: hypothetical protein VIV56_14140 [Gemmatimonadales bacterium]